MLKRAFVYPLILAFSVLLPAYVNAGKPEITTVRDAPDGQERLRVVGSFTVPAKSDTDTPLTVRIRTIIPADFGTEAEPGPITIQRGGPLMDYYEGGRRAFKTTIDQAFSLWDGRLKEMSGATAYALETEEGTFIGHAGIGRQTPEQLVFFMIVNPEFQRRGITRGTFMHLLETFIPELQIHPITAPKMTPFKSVLVKMDVTNPLETLALRKASEFAASDSPFKIGHRVWAPSIDAFSAYAATHTEEFQHELDPALKRTEHRWTITLPEIKAPTAAAE